MNHQQLLEQVKLAYAYGASVALQEAGLDQATAEQAGIKLAEEAMVEEKRADDEGEGEGIHPALLALLGAGGGAALGAGAGGLVGKLTGKNLLSRGMRPLGKAVDRLGGPANVAGVPSGGLIDTKKIQALQEAAQLTPKERLANKLHDLLMGAGRMGSIRGSAAAGAGMGGVAGGTAGGLLGGLQD